MLPRIGILGTMNSTFSESVRRNSSGESDFSTYLSRSVQKLNLNAQTIFEKYERPKFDLFASEGKLVNGMVFTPGKGIIPRGGEGYSNVYVRMVINGKLIEFTGLKENSTGEYTYRDIRVQEIPAWWRWSTEHLVVSRISDKNMGYFLDFSSGVRGVTKFMSIEIEREPYESLDYIADALDFLHARGEDVRDYALKIYQVIRDSRDEKSILALNKWLRENRERLERWGIT